MLQVSYSITLYFSKALFFPVELAHITVPVTMSLYLLVTFGVKNSQPIRLYYYLNIETGAFPLYGLVYISIVIGIIIGMIVGIYSRFDLRRTVKKLQQENRELKEKARCCS